MAHVRERSPGVWEIIVSAGVDRRTGRYRQISRTVKATQRGKGWPRAVTDMVHQLEADAEAKANAATSATVAVLLDEYIEQKRTVEARATKTIVGYQGIATTVNKRLGQLRIRRLSAADLDGYYRWLRTELGPFSTRADAEQQRPQPRKTENGWICPALEARTVSHHHALISQALNLAIAWRWLSPPNPADAAHPPEAGEIVGYSPTVKEIRILIRNCVDDNPDFAALILVAALTGCRRGEVCGWRFRNIDLDAGELTVAGAVSDAGGVIADKPTKTKRIRRLALDDLSIAIFSAQWDRYVDQCHVARVKPSRDAYVFSQEDDHSRPWRPDRVTHTFGRLRRKAGPEHIQLAHLRKFADTNLIAKGVDVRTVASRQGHDPAVALRHYAQRVDERDRDAAAILGELLGPAAKELLG